MKKTNQQTSANLSFELFYQQFQPAGKIMKSNVKFHAQKVGTEIISSRLKVEGQKLFYAVFYPVPVLI